MAVRRRRRTGSQSCQVLLCFLRCPPSSDAFLELFGSDVDPSVIRVILMLSRGLVSGRLELVPLLLLDLSALLFPSGGVFGRFELVALRGCHT
jgi:hypothetical protein